MQSGLWHQTQSFISIVIRLSMLQNFLLITKTSFSFVVCLFNFEASVTTWKWNLGQMHLLFHLFRLYCCAPREVWSNCSYRPAVNEPGREWEASDLQSLQKRGRTSRFVYDAMDDNFETRHWVKLKLWSYKKASVHLHPEHFTIAHFNCISHFKLKVKSYVTLSNVAHFPHLAIWDRGRASETIASFLLLLQFCNG